MLATYAVAALIMKTDLTPSKIFSSMIIFGNLRAELQRAHMILGSIVRGRKFYPFFHSRRFAISDVLVLFYLGRVSLDRFNSFFKETDLLDSYSFSESPSAPSQPLLIDDGLYLRNASFTWTPDSANDECTPSSSFKLTVPGELRFMEGKINLIIGPTCVP